MKGRYIGENILKITNLMDYVDENKMLALLLSAGFQKAFDSLEWDCVDCCLQLFNCGPSLRKWANISDTNITTRVSNNGWVTNIYYPSRGSRQGCPLSSYVFIICAEILGFLIQNTPHIEGIRIDGTFFFLVNQYADDTIIIISYSEENLRNICHKF